MDERTGAPPQRDTGHPLVPIIREKLLGLGAYDHLLVYLEGDHIFIAQPGNSADEPEPVLRLSGIGQYRFGQSIRRANDRWEPVPVAGVVAHVLAEAVTMFGAWLALRPVFAETSGTDH